MQDVLDRLNALNVRMGKQVTDDLSASANSAFAACLLVACVGLILAIALGIVLTVTITRPMKAITEAAERISVGDVNHTVECKSRDEIGLLAEAFRKIVAMLKERATAAGKIAAGDLKVTVEAASEQDELGRGLANVVSTLQRLMDDMDRMSREHTAGDIDAVIDAAKFQGDYKKVAQGINDMVGGHIQVKKKAMACIAEFGRGNFEAPLEKFPGKKVFINDTIEQLRTNLKSLMAEMAHMSKEHDAGDIDVKIASDKFQGDFQKVAEGINNMVGGHIQVKKKAMACIAEFGRGNFEAPLEKFPGKKVFINETIEQVRTNLKSLIADTDLLVKAALKGELKTRAEAGKHSGDFRRIVEGINATLDAVIGPLKVSADYVDKIGKGEIPAKITDNYNGDFNLIKNNLNACIDGLGGLVEANKVMQRLADNDITKGVEDLTLGFSRRWRPQPTTPAIALLI